jgi:hypothetical protein
MSTKGTRRCLSSISLVILFLTSCIPLFSPIPTITILPSPTSLPSATSTATAEPTSTFTPTATQTFTPAPTHTAIATRTPTSTPELSCSVPNGKWGSKETHSGVFQLLTFVVINCKVTTYELWAFPAPSELYWSQGSMNVEIIDDHFIFTTDEGYGTFTIEGTFESETFSYGTVFFPKGFLVVDYTLTKDVTLKWTAVPET